MARRRKQVPLRIPPELYDAYERWAADEFRSVNAQIEAAMVEAARRAGRLGRAAPTPGSTASNPQPDTQHGGEDLDGDEP